MAKTRTRLCATCHKKAATSNGYCTGCDALRKAESRGKIAMPKTGKGKDVRQLIDRAFDLLDNELGAEVGVRGIRAKSLGDGKIEVYLSNEQQSGLLALVKQLAKEGGE